MNSNPPSPLPLNATSTTKDQAIKVKGARGRAFSAPLVSCVDVSPSCYSPLPEGCIRLLRLIPHQDKDAPIQCDLFNYPLLDSGEGIRPYDALSYAWGSSKKTRVISMDKHHISVTENLHIALSHLRDRFIERIIWVDAICINQSDIEERSHQVRFMTMIYAKASRVNVWLGEMEADSDQALEEIHRAAEEQSTKIDQRFQDAIFKLLQRPWFKRMWVLQEVAAAQHILIMCGSTKIDGYAFCLGLNSMKLPYETYPDLESMIGPAIYLIRHTIFHPEKATNESGIFSLNIRPLGELIDMYHTREAFDPRDKVYALLGIGSDNTSSDRLSPNYEILWKDLFQQLVKSLLSEQTSVVTWDGEEIALIESKGCVLGEVSAVERDGMWDNRWNVDIASKNTSEYLGPERKWSARWTLQSLAKPIRKGDLICLLEGAPKATVIRLCEDFCTVIAIAVTPMEDERTERTDINWPDLLRSITIFPRDFLLVWDWEQARGGLEDGENNECFINSRVPKHAKTELDNRLDKTARLQNIGLLLGDSEKYEELVKNLRKVMDASRRIFRRVYPQTEIELQQQLDVYVEKFKQVEDTLNNSNDLFLTFRSEMEEMSKKIKRLEKENLSLVTRHEAMSRNILEMADERRANIGEIEVLKKSKTELQNEIIYLRSTTSTWI